METRALENQNVLQSLFKEVHYANQEMETVRKSTVNLLENDLMDSLKVPNHFELLPTQIAKHLLPLKSTEFDSKQIDDVANAMRLGGNGAESCEAENLVKSALDVSSGLCKRAVLDELQQMIASKVELDSQLDSLLQLNEQLNSNHKVSFEKASQQFAYQSSDLTTSAEAQYESLNSISFDRNLETLGAIEQRICELEDECAQFAVPWVEIEGVSLRQYRQMLAGRYSHSKMQTSNRTEFTS